MAPRTGTSRNRLRPSGEIRSDRTAGTIPVVIGRSSTVTVQFDGPVSAASPDEHGPQLDCRRPCLLVVRASAAMDRGLAPYPSNRRGGRYSGAASVLPSNRDGLR